MNTNAVSDAVIRRLPRYYRQLEHLVASGTGRISSRELAEQLQLNPSQVRQDFNCFGGFGQQGYGYHAPTLLSEIGAILGLTRTYKVIIAGAGSFGKALCKHEGFPQKGFFVSALFDIDETIVGKQISGAEVLHGDKMEQYIRENSIDIGILTVPSGAAQNIADAMVGAGIKGIWNFVPVDITADVPVKNVHLIDILLTLSYAVSKEDEI